MGKSKPRQRAAIRVETGGEVPAAGSEERPDEAVPSEVRWFVQGVRALIGARRLAQVEVARLIGGGAPYLSNVLSLEPGKMRKFRFHYACMVARALKTDLLEILTLGRTVEQTMSRQGEGGEEP